MRDADTFRRAMRVLGAAIGMYPCNVATGEVDPVLRRGGSDLLSDPFPYALPERSHP